MVGFWRQSIAALLFDYVQQEVISAGAEPNYPFPLVHRLPAPLSIRQRENAWKIKRGGNLAKILPL